MILSENERQELLEASKPLMRWMRQNTHPHCEVRVSQDDAELMEGIAVVSREEVYGSIRNPKKEAPDAKSKL